MFFADSWLNLQQIKYCVNLTQLLSDFAYLFLKHLIVFRPEEKKSIKYGELVILG